MSQEQKFIYCKNCKEHTMQFRDGPSHVFHFIMSLFTMGFWLIIWMLSLVRFGGWKCSKCGRR